MKVLKFSKAGVGKCEIRLQNPKIPAELYQRLTNRISPRFIPVGLDWEPQGEEELPSQPLFFEGQRLYWLFESQWVAQPYALYINGLRQATLSCSPVQQSYILTGSCELGNAVGFTDFEIRDARGKILFALQVEVFPEKLDYKDDFEAMKAEITEVLYSLAFDSLKKTYAKTTPRPTQTQTAAEWLNLYRVLAEDFERSIDTVLRNPKTRILSSSALKPVDRIKRADCRTWHKVSKYPHRYCQGGGIELMGITVSHMQEQHRQISYDCVENRFVVWAVRQLLGRLEIVEKQFRQQSRNLQQVELMIQFIQRHRQRLLQRLNYSLFRNLGVFQGNLQFSTTLTMAPGYKEFYHRFLLLRKGLTFADNDLFKMDYKDIATLYEYWCLIKTVKLLKENPAYQLESSDFIKVEHRRLVVALKKGKQSAVHFRQRPTGQGITLYYNRTYKKSEIHTFDQMPDKVIEFTRDGYPHSFKYIIDAKYRFERGEGEGPEGYGPPADAIGQLHRYRDAIFWEEGRDDRLRVANKSLGGLILFPYPLDEEDFVNHLLYQSLKEVNIGAIPLQPGRHRENRLYRKFLDELFASTGEQLQEELLHYNLSDYRRNKHGIDAPVLVGLVPDDYPEKRWAYHRKKRLYYVQWEQSRIYPMEKVERVALYDQVSGAIQAIADVKQVEFRLGRDLVRTGITWSGHRKPEAICVLYHLGELQTCNLPCSRYMQGQLRHGYFLNSRLGIELALQHQSADLLSINTWEQYEHWKALRAKGGKFEVRAKVRFDTEGNNISEVTFVEHKDQSAG